jgi:tRNA C32,U32 (ribose-2'-O)-methylase TrmJ
MTDDRESIFNPERFEQKGSSGLEFKTSWEELKDLVVKAQNEMELIMKGRHNAARRFSRALKEIIIQAKLTKNRLKDLMEIVRLEKAFERRDNDEGVL